MKQLNYIFFIVLSLCFASCATEKDKEDLPASIQDGTITFSRALSRGTQLEEGSTLPSLSVETYVGLDKYRAQEPLKLTAAENEWTFDPAMYWEDFDASVSLIFNAVSPTPTASAQSADDTKSDGTGNGIAPITCSFGKMKQAIFVPYKIPALATIETSIDALQTTSTLPNAQTLLDAYKLQPDLLIAHAYASVETDMGTKPELDFIHALSSVSFSIQGNDPNVRVAALMLTDVETSGSIEYELPGFASTADAKLSATADGELANIFIPVLSTVAPNETAKTSITPAGGNLMALPQTLRNDLGRDCRIFALTTDASGNNAKVIQLRFPLASGESTHSWEGGKHYDYTLILDEEETNMEFTITAIAWNDEVGDFAKPEPPFPLMPQVGDVFYADGTYSPDRIEGKSDAEILGVVQWVNTEKKEDKPDIYPQGYYQAKIMSLDEARLPWANVPTQTISSLLSYNNGLENMRIVWNATNSYSSNPAFEWCLKRNFAGGEIPTDFNVTTFYSDGAKYNNDPLNPEYRWYLGATKELLEEVSLVNNFSNFARPDDVVLDTSDVNIDVYYKSLEAIQSTLVSLGPDVAKPLETDNTSIYPQGSTHRLYAAYWSSFRIYQHAATLVSFFRRIGDYSSSAQVYVAEFELELRVRATMEVECGAEGWD